MLLLHRSVVGHSLLCMLVFSVASVMSRGQTLSSANTKLALKAALVLTPEFCATKIKDTTLHRGDFEIGNAACAALEPALRGVFPDLIRVDESAAVKDAQVVLLPRVVDARTTQPGNVLHDFNRRNMVVELEWTVKDMSGRTVWIGTVQGTATGHVGSAVTIGKDRKILVQAAMTNAAEQSASDISLAPELRKFAGTSAPILPTPVP
jgi:hypothetical protein